MTEAKAKYEAGKLLDRTEFTPDTLRAAFSDPLRYVLPPGSMTLEPERVVAGKFADAWQEQVRERKLLAEFFWMCRAHYRGGGAQPLVKYVGRMIDDPLLFVAAQETSGMRRE